jgi:hypothetical protein
MANNLGGRSVAIWGESRPGMATPSGARLNVHFNYWHIRSQKNAEKTPADFFDVGIMAYGCSTLLRIRLYIPMAFASSSVEDLGHLFSDPGVASGIFNESLSATTASNSNHIKLQRGSATYSRVYVFTKNGSGILPTELSFTPDGEGTFVDICQPAIANGSVGLASTDSLYFRLRVRVAEPKSNPFSRTIKPADSWLLSSFDFTEFLDFRLNEARNLPVTITQQMWPGGQRMVATHPISRVDFLVVVGEAADVAAGVESNKKRLLESELWDAYTKTAMGCAQKLSDGMVIYHWKKVATNPSPDVEDFSAFIKLKIRRSGSSLVRRYLLVVALIGCISGLLTNVVWALLPSAPDPLTSVSSACMRAVEGACRKDSVNGRQMSPRGKTAGSGKGPDAQLQFTEEVGK